MMIETSISGLKIGLYQIDDRAVAVENFFSGNYSCTKLNYNLSHADGLLALGQHFVRSIGIDLEIDPAPNGYMSVAKEFFWEEEFLFLNNKSGFEQAECFLALWTAKEAYCKLNRSNLSDSFPGPDFTNWIRKGFINHYPFLFEKRKMDLVFKTDVINGKRYYISVVL